ncbi:replicative DNA helicase [Candidatus Parcubacteria bacterium]|nr:MAG: replicative DNA helicase [Candidatus Parcubacteria bacterium]
MEKIRTPKTTRIITGTIDKLPPQNIEAEQSVLGALMLDKEAIGKVADFLTPRDFYRTAHQAIFELMLELYEKREPIDVLSTSNRLREKKQLEEVGGLSYLTELVNTVPTAAHVVHYAKIIQRKRILRDLIEASNEISLLAYQEHADIDVLLDEAESKIFGISQHSLSTSFVAVKETLEGAFERIDKLSKGDGRLRGISTGFGALDNKLAGLQKSDLIILAARPSLGKTSFALDIARHAAVKEKKRVGIFSLEMSGEQLVDRLIASQAQVDLWRIRTGKLSMENNENDFASIRDALDILSEAPIFIFDSAYVNAIQMRTLARRLQAESGLDLLIVDYLQLMMARDPSVSEVQQITEISRALKGLAKELNIPIIAISQLSRAVEQRTPPIPKLSDLRSSGTIEQDADVVLFISRNTRNEASSEERNIADIIIAKHRNGPIGKVQLYFDETHVSFRNLDTTWQPADFL